MEGKLIYTPAFEEVSYANQYPDLIEFEKPWEKPCIQVGQGFGKISSEGYPLQSEGFTKCSALILRNKSTLESALFHIDEWNLNERQTPIVNQFMINYLNQCNIDSSEKEILFSTLESITRYEYPKLMKREEFKSLMEKLNSNGIIQACFVYGENSRETGVSISESLLNYLGIQRLDDIKVETGNYSWATVYYPKESKILIDRRKDKKVLSYSF